MLIYSSILKSIYFYFEKVKIEYINQTEQVFSAQAIFEKTQKCNYKVNIQNRKSSKKRKQTTWRSIAYTEEG